MLAGEVVVSGELFIFLAHMQPVNNLIMQVVEKVVERVVEKVVYVEKPADKVSNESNLSSEPNALCPNSSGASSLARKLSVADLLCPIVRLIQTLHSLRFR
jgi:hypothetical protein